MNALLLALALSPLLQLAERLRCAPDEGAARAALEELRLAKSGALGLPSEQLGRAGPPSVRAGSVDVVLHELHALAAHFPRLREGAAALVAEWNACALDGGAADLVSREHGLERPPSARPFPLAGQGFADAAADGSLAPEGQRACWAERKPPPGAEAPDYPYAYQPACEGPAPLLLANNDGVVMPLPGAAQAPPLLPGQVAAPGPASGRADQTRPDEVPVPGAAYIGGGIAAGGVLFKRHLTGSAYAAWILEGRYALGANVLWSPISYLFVRGGAGYRVGLDHSPYYSWGAGYDDWHTGTFSLQINNWGPTLPAQGLDWQHAVIDLGYKLPRLCRQAFCLSSYVALDLPLQDTAFAALRMNLTFREVWFVRLGLDAVFNGSVRFVYGFGRFDWHRFAVNLSYDNWGPNPIPEPRFRQNGVITLGMNFGI